jgi:tetratricopeptide (TPR) repeat protein
MMLNGTRRVGRLAATVVAGLALAAAAGCGGGGGGGASGGGGTTAAGGGTSAPRTSTGEVVSEVAQNHWRDGLAAFQAREAQGGWNPGVCEQIAGQFSRAAEAQGGRFPEALYMAGLSWSRCNEREKALDFYNRALAVNDKFCKARVMVGLDQLAQGNEQAALQTFIRSTRDDSQCTEGYVNQAAIQRTQGAAGVREALNNLRRALAIDAQYLPAFNEMALLYIAEAERDPASANQRLDLAAVVCRQAQQINRNYGPIYNTWGLIYVKKDNIIEAVRMFERAASLDNNNFEAWMNFGTMVLGFRGYEDAKRAFERAAELNPRNYDAQIGLGAALRGLNQFDQAIAAYNRAKEIDPARPEAYFNLATLYHNYRGGADDVLAQAKDFYQQFVAKAGNNERFRDAVAATTRRCNLERARRGRRRSTSQCQPGYIQQIEQVAQVRAEMAELQRQQEEMMRRMQQQQQQQGGGAAPAPQ